MPPSADPSVLATLDHVKASYPAVPFLALGQTALWDEPTKAVWRRLLDLFLPQAELVAGVHDTDYFAKTVAHLGSDQKYVALPHDDGKTRDLWSAAGEMSALFGSESVPTRALFEKHGVPFDQLANAYEGGKEAFYQAETTAWGWRGIAGTESHDVIAHDVPILEIQDALLAQMDWAFAQSVAGLEDAATRDIAARTAAAVRSWVMEFLRTCDANCRLSDLYQSLLPRFYALLLGDEPAHFTATASTELFLFTPDTCERPRFDLLRVFLDPQTRKRACTAYNRAVEGSGIYSLSHFDEGALPFDVVIPARGRGTLRLTAQGIMIDTHPAPLTLPGAPTTKGELAQILQEAFGDRVVLVGKAVTLVDMLACEFLVVFHETASGYTTRTQTMNTRLGALCPAFYPIIRLSYPTWDALSAVPPQTMFRLPPHLASTFGTETIAAPDFARRWRAVLDEQRQVLLTVRNLHKTRDLMRYLETRDRECWCDQEAEYEAALGILKGVAVKSDTLAARMDEHAQEFAMWKQERQTLEQRKGEDWRANIQPLREKLYQAQLTGGSVESLQRGIDRQMALRATAFDEPLALCRERMDATRFMLAEFRRQRRLLERGRDAAQAREMLAALTTQAQMARLVLVRDAHLTVDGLEHTHLRPTSWWLPLVDPSGAWFEAIVEGTQARLEYLTAPQLPT